MTRRNLMLPLVLTLCGLSLPVGLAAAPQAAVSTLEVRGRKIVGDMTTVRVKRGDAVTLRWSTDEAVSIHLHGYDIEKDVKPGSPTEFSFKAYATGRFPITAHGYGDGPSVFGRYVGRHVSFRQGCVAEVRRSLLSGFWFVGTLCADRGPRVRYSDLS